MENGEKSKNLSNGTSWFLWGGAFGLLAIISGNNIVYIVFGIISCSLIFMGFKKRKAFDDKYLQENPVESNEETIKSDALLDDAKTEEKDDVSNPPDDH